ncbi:DUF4153 domain-containing protein [Psychrobium sp. MM17-31]|uniref:DUF4153 domain-containing protein n=1 Tax=Psychrobium sp. MM17-31 TaxID=2917758 RepID=UPI001EF49A0B|nr:DUF4153 domain-containing protein [Psychrobium sp. MM17-31]
MKNFINSHTLVGLLQGLVIAIFAALESSSDPFGAGYALIDNELVVNQTLLHTLTFSISMLLLFIQLTPTLHQLKKTNKIAWLMIAGFHSLMWGLGYLLLAGLDDDYYAIWFLIYTIVSYFILPFVQLAAAGHTKFSMWFGPQYHQLFSHAWCNAILVKFGWFTVGVVWLVLMLWWSLFEVIGIDFFEELFTDKWFAWPVLGMVFGIALYTAQHQLTIIDNLKRLLLKMCGLLLPLVALLTLSFVASVAVTGLDKVWDTGVATPLILVLVFLNILLINGSSLPESESATALAMPQNKFFKWTVFINIAALSALMLIAVYSTYLRIDQYGWTVPRVYLALLVLVMSLYSVAYLGLLIKRDTNFNWLRRSNVAITWLVLALVIVTHSPAFNPINMTINSQLSRLQQQSVSAQEFDYALFQFELGKRGQQALINFIEQEQHPQLAEIKTLVAMVQAASSKYDFSNKKDELSVKPIKVNWLNEPVIDNSEIARLIKLGNFRRKICQEEACYAHSINLDDDDGLEVLLIMGHGPMLYVMDSILGTNRWYISAEVENRYGYQDIDEFIDKLKSSPIETVPRRYKSIKIGDSIYGVDAMALEKNADAEDTSASAVTAD